jgi:hypothetical protein
MGDDAGILPIWLLMGLDFVAILATVAVLRRRQKAQGPLSPNLVAAVTSGLLTIVILSTFAPLLRINPRVVLAFLCAFLAFGWVPGFLLARWLYRKFRLQK